MNPRNRVILLMTLVGALMVAAVIYTKVRQANRDDVRQVRESQ